MSLNSRHGAAYFRRAGGHSLKRSEADSLPLQIVQALSDNMLNDIGVGTNDYSESRELHISAASRRRRISESDATPLPLLALRPWANDRECFLPSFC